MFNIGLIGAGMIAENHIQNLIKTGKVNITWINARTQSTIDRVAEKYNIPNRTTDYTQVLADASVDAVVITTPPNLHKKMFIAAVKAGKHILTEKPLAMNLKEVDEMIAAKNERPELKVSGCSARHARLQPKYVKVKEIIDSGALGEIYYIHHNSNGRQSRPGIEYHPTAKWFLNKDIAGGGPLFDWGVYDLSFHLGLLNDQPELEKVDVLFMRNGLDNKDPETDVYDVEEHFAAKLKFSGGLDYYWERASHNNVEVPNETRIYGTKGGIKLAFCSWDAPEIEFYSLSENGTKAISETIIPNMDGHDDGYALAEHFVNVLEGLEEVQMTLELARKHLDIILKCYEKA
ncbi:MAG: Gfo/Idh/MocA family protein [Prolixibacteraceae bacterium]